MVASTPIPLFPSRPFPAREWLKQRAAAARPAATTPPSPVPSGEMLDLILLVSCLPEWLHSWLIAELQPLAAQPRHPRQRRGWIAPLRAGFLLLVSPQSRLSWLRARLRDELDAGLLIVATPLSQCSRPARNRALLAHAEAIGQLAQELERQPGAGSPGQELVRLLARLRR